MPHAPPWLWGRARFSPGDSSLAPIVAPAAQVRPACLPMYGQRFQTGRSCFITGFGKTRENEGEGGPWLPAGSPCPEHSPAGALEAFPAGMTPGSALPAARLCRNETCEKQPLPPSLAALPALQITPPQSCGRPR